MIIIQHWFPSNHRLQSHFKQLKLSCVKPILEKFLIYSKLDPRTTIGVYITTPKQIARLYHFKGKWHSTDTLSFPYHPPSTNELNVVEEEGNDVDESKWCLGEIVLCPERIIKGRRGSVAQNLRLKELLAHSFVHLLGYDHHTLSEYRQMRLIERSLHNQLSSERMKNSSFF